MGLVLALKRSAGIWSIRQIIETCLVIVPDDMVSGATAMAPDRQRGGRQSRRSSRWSFVEISAGNRSLAMLTCRPFSCASDTTKLSPRPPTRDTVVRIIFNGRRLERQSSRCLLEARWAA